MGCFLSHSHEVHTAAHSEGYRHFINFLKFPYTSYGPLLCTVHFATKGAGGVGVAVVELGRPGAPKQNRNPKSPQIVPKPETLNPYVNPKPLNTKTLNP